MIKEKRWEPKFEKSIFQNWIESGKFKFNPESKKEIFAIDTPPPTANAKWHIGGAGAYSFLDMIARIQRMKGYEVLLPWCSDRNGLPMEVSVEKKHNIKMQDTPREKFIMLTAKWAEKIGKDVTQIAKKMGVVAEYEGDFYYETDKPYYRKLTQSTFIELWKKGLVYEDSKPNNYCVSCGTTIADAEIEYEKINTNLIHLNFKTKDGEDLEISTTRPELLGACAAILYNPKDDRYKTLENKKAIVPIYNKEIPIISHPSAKKEFGTGLMMLCSYGDYTDVRLFRELELDETILIDKNGLMNEKAGNYSKMRVSDAREKIIEDLKSENVFIKSEKTKHRTPSCWRCKTPIEFVAMPEFYLKQVKFKEDLKQIAKNIKFHPKEYKQNLLDWINSVSRDWVISRRRYYGTEIPLWYCKKCEGPWVPEPGEYYQPWKDEPPEGAICKCGSKEFFGEERTFDTWMDSSISELFITGYKRLPKLFENAFPCSLRNQGKDIIRSWLYYTLLRAYQLFEKPAFEHVFINGFGVDEHGKKMSKSVGNITEPLPVLEEYGADAFRFWVASETSIGNDFRYSEEKINASQKFLTKLWNLSRFISMFELEGEDFTFTKTDEWILSELNKTIEKCSDGYGDFNFFVPANKIKNFSWNIFADHYLEMVKSRAYNRDGVFSVEEKNGAIKTLRIVLKNTLKLLAPICPFITEKIWTEMFSKESIHLETYPEKKENIKKELSNLTEKIMGLNSSIWKTKKEKGMGLNSEIEGFEIPEKLKLFEKDLIHMHKIK